MEKLTKWMPLRVGRNMLRFVRSEAEREHIQVSQYIRKLIREAMERANGKKESKG